MSDSQSKVDQACKEAGSSDHYEEETQSLNMDAEMVQMMKLIDKCGSLTII